MDRVFAANGASAAPTDIGTVTYPSDGNPSLGQLPTIPGAYWFWMITAELLAVLTMGGVTANGSTLNQVATAISNIATSIANAAAAAAQAAAITIATNTVLGWFTGSNQSLATNGYQKWPGGRIDQEVSVFVGGAAHTLVTVTYPITFPTLGKPPMVSIIDPSETALAGNFLGMSIISYSNTGCVIALDANGGGNRDVTVVVRPTGN